MKLRERIAGFRLFAAPQATRIVLGLVLINLLVVGLACLSLWESYTNYERHAGLEAENLAQLVAKDIESNIRIIDVGLRVVAFEYLRGHSVKAGSPLALEAFNAYVEQVRAGNEMIEGLRIADASGRLIQGSGVDSSKLISVADRDYFRQLRDDAGAELVLGEPVKGKVAQIWVIPVARAMRRPDGTLAGVVVGALPTSRMSEVFSRLKLGPRATVLVFSKQLRVAARHPEAVTGRQSTGDVLTGPGARGIVASGKSTFPAFHNVSAADGIDRVSSAQQVGTTPYFTAVGLDWSVYLAQWRGEMLRTLGMAAMFVVTACLLAWYVYRGWSMQARAVAAMRDANRTLDAEKQLTQTIIQSSPFAIYTRDINALITAWNPAAEKLFGWRAEEILGKPLLSVPVDKKKETDALRDRVLSGETVIQLEVQRQKRDGTLFDLSTTLAPLRDASGEIDGYLAIATDITDRKASEKQIEFLAYRDVLTGLPNRLLLQDRFEQAMGHAERAESKMALLFLDLDNFKTINDSLGHAVGDLLLKEIAARLGECVRDTDTISRQGGDEFLIVLSDLRGRDAITPVLLKIRERLQAPFELDGHELSTSVSMGVAIYPDDGRDFDTLLKKADTAMYRAKDAGRNSYRFFDAQMNIEAVEHLSLKSGLSKAVARGEFVLHYQPQIDLTTGAVVAVEALIRWNHPELGMLAPARFIPVAEDSGLIVPIGEWVIREACRQAVAWQAAGLPPLVMAVNLSAVQCKRGDVEQSVLQALKETGFDPHFLELELTESILLQNTEQVLASVQRLKLLGVKLSIDDFGTGYSSLSYLKRFDVDKLKIDQSFIRDLGTDPDDAAIILAIIQMARSLNLKTVAEGVETAEMVARLRQFKCDEAQGYYFARPMPAPALFDFLVDRGKRLTAGHREWSAWADLGA